MKKKRVNKNTVKEESEQKSPFKLLEEYRNIKYMKYMPVTDEFLEGIEQLLITWAQKTNSHRIDDFHDENGWDRETFRRWCTFRPSLIDAKLYAMRRIVSNRDEGAITKKYDGNYIFKTMPAYSSAFRKLEAWRAKLKEDSRDITSYITVIEKMPDVPEVPVREKD